MPKNQIKDTTATTPGVEKQRQKEIIRIQRGRYSKKARSGSYGDDKPAKPENPNDWAYMAKPSEIQEFLVALKIGRYAVIGDSEKDAAPTRVLLLRKIRKYDPDLYEKGKAKLVFPDKGPPFKFVALYDYCPVEVLKKVVPVYSIRISFSHVELVCRGIDNLFVPTEWARVEPYEVPTGVLEKVTKWKR